MERTCGADSARRCSGRRPTGSDPSRFCCSESALRIALRAVVSRCVGCEVLLGWLSPRQFTERPEEAVMDRELNLDELLQRRLSRRDLFRNAGAAGISR